MLEDWNWEIVDKVNYNKKKKKEKGRRPITKRNRGLMQQCETNFDNALLSTFNHPNKLWSMKW